MATENWDKKYRDYHLIDFLENKAFREKILDAENDTDETAWEELFRINTKAKEARLILRALKEHFEQYELSDSEIERRLAREIDKYREKARTSEMAVILEARKKRRKAWIGGVAAAIMLLIGAMYLYQWMNRPFDEYRTGFGEQLSIELPDSSFIQLNSNSVLTWNRDWKSAGIRTATLQGEAFFKVKKSSDMSFYVKTGDATIEVTGTQFNVNSRREKTRVFLEEGKVNVGVDSRPEEKYELNPGEEWVYLVMEDRVEKSVVEASEEISGWKEGLLIFQDAPLMEVLESVSDIYGKEFIVGDSILLARNITTTIPLTNWEVSLSAIRLAMRLDVEESGDEVRVKEKD